MGGGFLEAYIYISGFLPSCSLTHVCYWYLAGISASFAVKMFKAWISEKDANAVTSALRKANLDKKLLVRNTF